MSEPRMHIYTPLQHDEVRVLRCRRPSTSAGPTGCYATIKGPAFTALSHEIRIDKVTLTACPPFVALSYVWGSPDRDYRLTLCDNSLLPITKSVAEALSYVLDDMEDGFIWIYQICINQSDTEEKNQQVAKMGDIYSQACRVFVWLGPEGDGAERGELNYRNGAQRSFHILTGSPSQQASNDINNEVAMVRAFRWHPDTTFHVTCLFRNIGRESFSEFLDHEVSYLRKNHPFQIMRNNKGIHEDFHLLLSRMSNGCKVSEPRDLVYAFLALNKDHRIQIRPTYDVPVYRVFTEVARAIIAATGNLDILAVAPTIRATEL
ncbi:hypothetical protein CEP53_011727 [Fusarium sp. AF-6]|nr:hypothetical protein CEP53_011727 [Fusarium sp. AF-6]